MRRDDRVLRPQLPSLDLAGRRWLKRAVEVNRRLAGHVDVMFGNEEDFSAALGFEIEGVGDAYDELDTASYVRCSSAWSASTRT
jgi:sugar/nucleoside kinase (ribokinase family)